jgi:hypothetical protein
MTPMDIIPYSPTGRTPTFGIHDKLQSGKSCLATATTSGPTELIYQICCRKMKKPVVANLMDDTNIGQEEEKQKKKPGNMLGRRSAVPCIPETAQEAEKLDAVLDLQAREQNAARPWARVEAPVITKF